MHSAASLGGGTADSHGASPGAREATLRFFPGSASDSSCPGDEEAAPLPPPLAASQSAGSLTKVRLTPLSFSAHQAFILSRNSIGGVAASPDDLVAGFRRQMLRRERSLVAAWRVLDPPGNGRCGFPDVCRAALKLGYIVDARRLWEALDCNQKGFVCLEDFDPEQGRLLRSLWDVVRQVCGSAAAAWSAVFATRGAEHVKCCWPEFEQASYSLGFTGSARGVFDAFVGRSMVFKDDKDRGLEAFRQAAAAVGFHGDHRLLHAALRAPHAKHPNDIVSAVAAGSGVQKFRRRQVLAEPRGGVCKEDFLLLDRWFRPAPPRGWRFSGTGFVPAAPVARLTPCSSVATDSRAVTPGA